MSDQLIWPYLVSGSPDNPPLVFLHGFLGAAEDWQPIMAQFTGDFYCIAPDLPGHGRNLPAFPTTPLTFDTLSENLIQLFNTLELSHINLVGYSMGGRLGLYTAVHHPHRIHKLVLEGTSPGIIDEHSRHERATLDDQRAQALLAEGMEMFLEQWYNMPLFQTLHNKPNLLATIKTKRRHNNPTWMAKIISDLSPGRQPAVWDKLVKLTMPVLLVAGEQDTQYVSLAHKMQTKISSGTAEIIPNSGHNVHSEAQKEFITQVKHFLLFR